MAERHFVKYTFLKLDPAWRRLGRRARAQDKREFLAACEDFADRPPAAGLLAGGHARRRRADAGLRGREPRPHPRVPRRAGPERPDEVGAAALLVPGHAQELGVLRRRAHRPARASRASTCSSTRSSSRASGTRCRPRSAGGSCRGTSRSAANTRASTTTRPTRSGSTTRSSWSPSTPTTSGTFLDLVQRLRTTEASRFTRARHAALHLHQHAIASSDGADRARRPRPLHVPRAARRRGASRGRLVVGRHRDVPSSVVASGTRLSLAGATDATDLSGSPRRGGSLGAARAPPAAGPWTRS